MLQFSQDELTILSSLIFHLNQSGDLDDVRLTALSDLRKLIVFDEGAIFMGQNINNEKTLNAPIFLFTNDNHDADKAGRDYIKLQKEDYASWMFHLPHPSVYKDTDLLDDSLRQQTNIYNAMFRAGNVHYAAGIVCVIDNILLGTLTVFRHKSYGDFNSKEMGILRFFEPHLTRRLYQLHPQCVLLEQQVRLHSHLKTQYGLTSKEMEIVDLVCQGKSNDQIANHLFVSPSTVKKHLQHVFKKTRSNSRTMLVKTVLAKDDDF